jgi:CII-binding regulator of phage lambda lysogenization HflD
MSSLILQIELKAFSLLNAARTFLTTLDLEKKYSTQKQIVDQLSNLHQNVKDTLIDFFDYVIRDRF